MISSNIIGRMCTLGKYSNLWVTDTEDYIEGLHYISDYRVAVCCITLLIIMSAEGLSRQM